MAFERRPASRTGTGQYCPRALPNCPALPVGARSSIVPSIEPLTVSLRPGRGGKGRRLIAAAAAISMLSGACGSSGPKPVPTTSGKSMLTTSTPSTSTSSTSTSTTTTTTPLTELSGDRTVLSPIGLNVRAGPSKSAAVIGTAAQGVVLRLLGHTSVAGGWYKVRGSTVTGWITADPADSAPGRFGYYTSSAFNILYPGGWTSAGSPGLGVTFRSPNPVERVVVTAAPTLAKLGPVHQGSGVSVSGSQHVVACGVTTVLYSYATPTPGYELADVVVPAAAHHFIGIRATLKSPKQLATVLDFVNSLSFPFPVCIGRPPPAKTTKTTTSKTRTSKAEVTKVTGTTNKTA